MFEFDTSSLEPGTHQFVLVAMDGFGESVTKIYPFIILQGELKQREDQLHVKGMASQLAM